MNQYISRSIPQRSYIESKDAHLAHNHRETKDRDHDDRDQPAQRFIS